MDAHTDSPNLDFLRSVAVLFVVVFHILWLLEHTHHVNKERLGGFHSIGNWGVLIFFVHTSLVLMFSLERQHRRFPGESAWPAFLIRRAFRIYPLSMFVVAMVALYKIPVGDMVAGRLVNVPLNWSGLLADQLLVQNLTRSASNLIPLWSLPFEMQMYLFLPALYLFVRKTRSLTPVALMWLAAYVIAIPAWKLDQRGFPNLLEFAPLFLSGIVAYALLQRKRLQLPSRLWPVAIAAISTLYLLRPIPARGCACALLLGVAVPQFREISLPMVRGAARIVARYSYGIYLTHFIAIWLAFQACIHFSLAARIAIFLTTAIVLPVLAYHGIEEPMIRMGSSVVANLRSSRLPAMESEAA